MTPVMWFITAIVIIFVIFMLAVAIVQFIKKVLKKRRHATYILEITNEFKK